jgi:hypothetical protein
MACNDNVKRETLKKIAELPQYTDQEILRMYAQLVQALHEPAVQALSKQAKTAVLRVRFPEFALGYGALFHMACNRDEPYTVDKVQQIMGISAKLRDNVVTLEKARGICMDLAETDRRNRA